MSNVSNEKKRLRRQVRTRRNAFVQQMTVSSRNLAFRVPPSPLANLLESAQNIAVYDAVGAEATASGIAHFLWKNGKTALLPHICAETDKMTFRSYQPDDLLVLGPHQIKQPSIEKPKLEPDVIISPLIAFDRHLNRLGQGGGYYDKAFEAYPKAIRIGLAWSAQEIDLVPVEAHDMRLHFLITECEFVEHTGEFRDTNLA